MTTLDQQPKGPERTARGVTRSFLRRLLRGVLTFVLTAVVIIAGIWAIAALALTDLDGASPRFWLAGLLALAFLVVIVLVRPHRRARLIAAAMVAAVAAWYWTRFPSNDRAWLPEYAKLATATMDGDQVTLHNYRVLSPGPDGALQQHYVDQTFDLSKLRRADLIISYWGPKQIAHALVSFEFTDGRYAAESIEVRRRASQKGFQMVQSLFRNFELIYVVGDERALIGSGILDDHHRVYLYRTNISQERSRALFLRYANKLNELAAHPQWYNAITDNCTTGIYFHLREIPQPPPFSINILINGYLPEYIYRQGNLDRSMSWDELNRLCDIKETGRQAYDSPDFSRIIRERVPLPSRGTPPGNDPHLNGPEGPEKPAPMSKPSSRALTAKVTAMDAEKHKATLQFEDGSTETVPVRPDVDLSRRKVGDKVVIHSTEALAIRIVKPQAN
jgi:hypothetical protein